MPGLELPQGVMVGTVLCERGLRHRGQCGTVQLPPSIGTVSWAGHPLHPQARGAVELAAGGAGECRAGAGPGGGGPAGAPANCGCPGRTRAVPARGGGRAGKGPRCAGPEARRWQGAGTGPGAPAGTASKPRAPQGHPSRRSGLRMRRGTRGLTAATRWPKPGAAHGVPRMRGGAGLPAAAACGPRMAAAGWGRGGARKGERGEGNTRGKKCQNCKILPAAPQTVSPRPLGLLPSSSSPSLPAPRPRLVLGEKNGALQQWAWKHDSLPFWLPTAATCLCRA